MIFRQMLDYETYTYTYLIASRPGGEAIIIDSVLDRVERYLQLIEELDLKLVKAFDTHVHADHITGLGALRDRTQCTTIMSATSSVDVVSRRVEDGETIELEGLTLTAMLTPGHTDDSCCLLWEDKIFTGDTLFIRGSGRTDFQNGDPSDQYDSLFNKILKLPDDTLVYPGHDYKGDMVSTIGEEKKWNPRLQAKSREEFVDMMNNLNLDNPKFMDVAVPANLHIGLSQDEITSLGWAHTAAEAMTFLGDDSHLLIDLRDQDERERHGTIAGSVHAPYGNLKSNVASGGMLHELAQASGKEMVFYCAYGERSAMAVRAARDAGIENATHITGGLDAWKKAGGPTE